MTVACSTIRQNILKLLNASRMVTATSQGAAAGASYISTDLKKWDGGNDDHYIDKWILTTSGATQESKLILDYVSSTGTITPTPSFSAQIANAVTAEIMPWEPTLILDSIQRAIDSAYPNPLAGRKGLFLTLFEEIITNSYIWNGHFEDFTVSTIPDHWAKSGTATVSAETTITRGTLTGNSSVKMLGGGATDYIYQSEVENPALLNLAHRTVTFYTWAYASAASKARLTVGYKIASDAAYTTTSSSYHSGNSHFELLSVEVTIPASITNIQIRLENSAATVYFDNTYHDLGPWLYRYHMSKDFLHDPMTVEIQLNDGDTYGADMMGGERWESIPKGMWHVEDDGTYRYLVIHKKDDVTPYVSASRRKLRIVGNETLSMPTGDTSTIEVAGDQMRALVALAAGELMLSIEGSAATPDDQIIDYKGRAAQWRAEGERLLALFGKPFPLNNTNMRIR